MPDAARAGLTGTCALRIITVVLVGVGAYPAALIALVRAGTRLS